MNERIPVSDLIAYREIVFGEFERARDEGGEGASLSRKAKSLAFQVASLDESIGEELEKTGEVDKAAYYFVSQGQYLIEIGHIKEARTAWEKAKSIATKDVIKRWVDEGLQKYV